jgi:hypothetical protein
MHDGSVMEVPRQDSTIKKSTKQFYNNMSFISAEGGEGTVAGKGHGNIFF